MRVFNKYFKLIVGAYLLLFYDLFSVRGAENLSGLEKAGALLPKFGGPAGFDVAQNDPAVIIARGLIGLLSLVGVIFLILMVYGGLRWMTARGESEIVEKSKGIIRNAITGIIVTFLAYAIVYTISFFIIK